MKSYYYEFSIIFNVVILREHELIVYCCMRALDRLIIARKLQKSSKERKRAFQFGKIQIRSVISRASSGPTLCKYRAYIMQMIIIIII